MIVWELGIAPLVSWRGIEPRTLRGPYEVKGHHLSALPLSYTRHKAWNDRQARILLFYLFHGTKS